MVTIVGVAGVGKSRLLYEFDNWIELRPELVAGTGLDLDTVVQEILDGEW